MFCRCLSFLFVALLIAGCGGSGFKVSTVEGNVTVDGTPLETGSIIFSPLESGVGVAVSTEIVAGKYQSNQVPRGRVLVQFSSFKDVGDKHVEFGITYPKLKNMIPEKYHAGVELNVDQPKLTHHFELTSK
jgi:hypothetical protein